MLPSSNRGVGTAMGFPDVCATPTPAGPVPIPYPNVALNAQAVGFSPGVKVCMMNALNLGTQIPITSGDEAGSAHPTIKGAARFTMGSPNVNIDGLPAITLTSLTTHNNMNCPVGAMIVPSAVNVFFSFRADDAADPRAAREVAPDELAELGVVAAPGGALDVVEGATGSGPSVRVESFAVDTAARLASALDAAARSGHRRVTLDLRGCPGGVLEGALDAAAALLPEGAEVATLVEADGDERTVRARGDRFAGLELVCWVDERTASAAELFVGALQAHGRATVLGTRTFGKGVAQRLVVGSDGRTTVVPTLTVLLPAGRPLDRVGITPDADGPPRP